MQRSDIKSIVGIDCGKGGGVAIHTLHDQKTTAHTMPATPIDMKELLFPIIAAGGCIVFLESVNMFSSDKDGKQFRIVKMLKNYEQLCTTLELIGAEHVKVSSKKWQSTLRIRSKGKEEYSARKKRFSAVAKKYYPNIKITLKTADAVLIMHYGRFIHLNNLHNV